MHGRWFRISYRLTPAEWEWTGRTNRWPKVGDRVNLPPEWAKTLQKLSIQSGGEWVPHFREPTFKVAPCNDGNQRIVAGVPKGDAGLFRALVNGLAPPYFFLYVLHTPRGEGEPGRYQSPLLDRDTLNAFYDRYSPFFRGDGRHDIWVHSSGDNATVVWDRHNLIFAYGPLDRFQAILRERGFTIGAQDADFPHQHHYRQEFDGDAADILTEFEWSKTLLRPADQQWQGDQ